MGTSKVSINIEQDGFDGKLNKLFDTAKDAIVAKAEQKNPSNIDKAMKIIRDSIPTAPDGKPASPEQAAQFLAEITMRVKELGKELGVSNVVAAVSGGRGGREL